MTICEETVKHIVEKLDKWKSKLIDLTRRNNLLNYRPSKRYSIKIIDELPSEVFKQLVVGGDKFKFKSIPGKKKECDDGNALVNIQDEIIEDSPEINFDETQFTEYNSENVVNKHKDLFLQTNLIAEDLERNLKYINRQAKQVMEEQGYNVLFLALGILQWYEAPQSDIINNSPIIMVPVEICRKKRKSADEDSTPNVVSDYELKLIDDDVFVNLALIYKLKNDFSLEIDEIPEDFSEFNGSLTVSSTKSPKSYTTNFLKVVEHR